MKLSYIGLAAIALGAQTVIAASKVGCNCDLDDTDCLRKCVVGTNKCIENCKDDTSCYIDCIQGWPGYSGDDDDDTTTTTKTHTHTTKTEAETTTTSAFSSITEPTSTGTTSMDDSSSYLGYTITSSESLTVAVPVTTTDSAAGATTTDGSSGSVTSGYVITSSGSQTVAVPTTLGGSDVASTADMSSVTVVSTAMVSGAVSTALSSSGINSASGSVHPSYYITTSDGVVIAVPTGFSESNNNQMANKVNNFAAQANTGNNQALPTFALSVTAIVLTFGLAMFGL